MHKKNCEICKYDYDKWCTKRGTCVDCPLYDADRPIECYCMIIGCYDDCPYFELAEEVNDA